MLPRTQQDAYDNAKSRRRRPLLVALNANKQTLAVGTLATIILVVILRSFTVTPAAESAAQSADTPPFSEGSVQKGLKVLAGVEPVLNDAKPRDLAALDTAEDSAVEEADPLEESLPPKEEEHDPVWAERKQKVVEAFKHAWKGYHQYALGFDELKPVSQSGENGLGGLGATVVDALDTAMVMGLGDVVGEAGTWIGQELGNRFQSAGKVNLFETTIRVLGGLLSAYHLSLLGQTAPKGTHWAHLHNQGPPPSTYLSLARDLGDRLITAFEASPTAVPFSDVHLALKTAHASSFDGGASSSAEVSTLGLEFGALSHVTGVAKFGQAAVTVVRHIQQMRGVVDGLVPIFISPQSGLFQGTNIRLGSRGDSYYEYLLKVWLQQRDLQGPGDQQPEVWEGLIPDEDRGMAWLRSMYDNAVKGIRKHLLAESQPSHLVFVGERPEGVRGPFSNKMDHLVCFLSGTLALGSTNGTTRAAAIEANKFSARDAEDLKLAEGLAEACYAMYETTATGLAPEIAYFHGPGEGHGEPGGNHASVWKDDVLIQPLDRHNLLRPETVESLFVLYRITRDVRYRDWGWKIFSSFDKYAKVESGGYTSLSDVTHIPPPKRDKMETFFLGETLKYFYLLFEDEELLPLDRYVFNTEAHPLPIWDAHLRTTAT